jgi:translation initiation factor 3 subunit G
MKKREGGSSQDSRDNGGRPPRDENATVRVTGLSEETKESDVSDLCRVFGPIQRIYLAKDKDRNSSKGFAFVSFVYKKDAAKAIEKLSGYGYDHLILRVEWAK